MTLIPPIGQSVERLEDGKWVRDYVCQIRIDHGPDPKDAEISVLWWGVWNQRFVKGYAWREVATNL